jgi:hypothetical protein
MKVFKNIFIKLLTEGSRKLIVRAIRSRHVCGSAQMVKLVDTPASGVGGLTAVEVQVLFWAPYLESSDSDIGAFLLRDGCARKLHALPQIKNNPDVFIQQ